MPARALLLDLDDTLVPSTAGYRAALQAVGIGPDGPARAAYERARARVKARLGSGHPASHNRVLYFKAMLDEEGRGTAAEVLGLVERYEAALLGFLSQAWQRLGRDALLERLAASRRIVVLTDETARIQLAKLRALDPGARWLRDLVASEELGAEKPDPRVLDAALERAGVAAAECLVVGDSVARDVAPALARGCRAALTREFLQDPASVPAGARVIERLDEVEALL